jgi:hypothetical protein
LRGTREVLFEASCGKVRLADKQPTIPFALSCYVTVIGRLRREGGMENTMTDKNEPVTASGAQCRLRLLPKHLPVAFAVGIKAIMFTPFPSGFQLGPSDVPVRTAFPQYSTQVLPELFDRGSAEEPVAVVDLEYNEARFEDDDMRDHRIVLGVGVLGDVEILLNLSSRIG